MKTLDPDYLAPEQFSKMAEGSDVFSYACFASNFVFTWVISITYAYAYVASENQASKDVDIVLVRKQSLIPRSTIMFQPSEQAV